MTNMSASYQSSIPKEHITGLILSGGKGVRMGGLDKGLILLQEQRLIERAVKQLGPQVADLLISCNRNIAFYKTLGYRIIQDSHFTDCGPLSGIYNALLRCNTPYLAIVPVDSVAIPADLVTRLSESILTPHSCSANSTSTNSTLASTNLSNPTGANTTCAIAHDGERTQPLFALIRTALKDNLAIYLQKGERRTHGWMQQNNAVSVDFSDLESAFININDPETLQQIKENKPFSHP